MSAPSTLSDRDLDSRVAAALGWELFDDDGRDTFWIDGVGKVTCREFDWCPSTDWRAMGELLAALRERGWIVDMYLDEAEGDQSARTWEVEVYQMEKQYHVAVCRFLPRAVAEAAVLALDGKR